MINYLKPITKIMIIFIINYVALNDSLTYNTTNEIWSWGGDPSLISWPWFKN